MKHYALVDENNTVVNISVADEGWDSTGWIEYTEDNKAFIGGLYINGRFRTPKPFDSWIFNEQTFEWESPIPKPEIDPENPKPYFWSESDQQWVEVLPTEEPVNEEN